MKDARRHALEDGSGVIDTSHLVLGLIDTLDAHRTRAEEIIERLGVDLITVRFAIRRMVPRGARLPDNGQQLPFTPGAKRCLERARVLATELGHARVGSAHLLLGAAELGDPTSAVLATMDLSADRIRASLNGR